jgi:hypothetical protein
MILDDPKLADVYCENLQVLLTKLAKFNNDENRHVFTTSDNDDSTEKDVPPVFSE